LEVVWAKTPYPLGYLPSRWISAPFALIVTGRCDLNTLIIVVTTAGSEIRVVRAFIKD